MMKVKCFSKKRTFFKMEKSKMNFVNKLKYSSKYNTNPLETYSRLISENKIRKDENQKRAVEVIDNVFTRLKDYEPILQTKEIEIHKFKHEESQNSKLFSFINFLTKKEPRKYKTLTNTNNKFDGQKINVYMHGKVVIKKKKLNL